MLEELFGSVAEGLGITEGISWGVGGAAIAVAALVVVPLAKPLAKGVIKGYIAAGRQVRELTAEAAESVQDVYADAKHEYESRKSGETAREAHPA